MNKIKIDEEILLCDMLGVERVDLYTQDLSLNGLQAVRLEDALKKRAKGEPLQYIMGKTEFFGLPFFVEQGVFIPRPETEILVDVVIRRCDNVAVETRLIASLQDDGIHILDLCTGSGCIAICLAKYAKCGKIIATDISGKAIEIAKKNAALNGVHEKIEFRQADLFEDIDGRFDIITCNPPYIKQADLEILPREVRYEPQIALDGGIDGLGFYRRIALEAPKFLRQNGILALEIGDGQAEEVKKMFLGKTEIIKDLNNIERVVMTKALWTK